MPNLTVENAPVKREIHRYRAKCGTCSWSSPELESSAGSETDVAAMEQIEAMQARHASVYQGHRVALYMDQINVLVRQIVDVGTAADEL